jgi:hypothetical protein
MTTLFSLASLAGGGVAVTFVVLWAIEYRRRGRVALERDRTRTELNACTKRRYALAENIAVLRKEIRDLETMLLACDDPAAIRDRIRKLLSK